MPRGTGVSPVGVRNRCTKQKTMGRRAGAGRISRLTMIPKVGPKRSAAIPGCIGCRLEACATCGQPSEPLTNRQCAPGLLPITGAGSGMGILAGILPMSGKVAWADRLSSEPWPGGKRPPYTPAGVTAYHSSRGVQLQKSGLAGTMQSV